MAAAFLWGNIAHAQNDRFALGAEAAGSGYTAQTTSNAFSVFNNTAGLANIGGFSAGAYAENRFMVTDINLVGLGVALPTKSGTFGLGLIFALQPAKISIIKTIYFVLTQVHSEVRHHCYGGRGSVNSFPGVNTLFKFEFNGFVKEGRSFRDEISRVSI